MGNIKGSQNPNNSGKSISNDNGRFSIRNNGTQNVPASQLGSPSKPPSQK